MMTDILLPSKDPDDVEPYYVVWCSEDNTNDGSVDDTGELQGATISSVTWTVPDGITKDSENEDQVVIAGITYAVNTVCTIWLSSGVAGTTYSIECKITTSDSRTLTQTIVIPVEEH